MQKITLEVSKKGNKEGDKRVAVGTVDIFVATLADMGVSDAPFTLDAEGYPVYADEKLDFVQASLSAACRAIARNRLESGTATLKAGKTIPTTVEELMEQPEGNKGAAMILLREFTEACVAYAAKMGKSAKAQATLASWLSKKSLSIISEENRVKAVQYITDCVADMSEADQAKFENTALGLVEVADAAAAIGDDEL